MAHLSFEIRPKEGLYILPLKFLSPNLQDRCAPSLKVYRMLGRRSNPKNPLRHQTDLSPKFYRGEKVQNFDAIFDTCRFYVAVVEKLQ